MAPELGTRAPGITRRARFGTIARRPALGRLIVAFACFRIAELGAWISVTTLAYSFGGVDEAGAVMVAQLAPAALAALVVHRLADHWGAQRVHVVGLVVQAGALALVGGLAAASASPGWI